MVTAAMILKDASWKDSYDKSRQNIKKQRYHIAYKGLHSQSCGFSSSHVQSWELDHEEGWEPKNWGFQIVLLEKTWEDCGAWRDAVHGVAKSQTQLSYSTTTEEQEN